jgi:hypothetical protein
MKAKIFGFLRPVFFISAGLFFVNAFISEAQISKESEAQISKESNMKGNILFPTLQVTKKEGWTIPIMNYLPPNKIGVADIEGVLVEKKALSPEEAPVNFENYYIRSNNEIKISNKRCLVRNIIAFESKGRRFAYQVIYSPMSDEGDRSGETTGAVYNIYFMDNDGDGIFEERLQQTRIPSPPQWVREL